MSDTKPLMALFGGTFDPFHRAHEWLCRQVLAQPDIAQLRLIPCQIPALKDAAQASPAQRLRMLELWVEHEPVRDDRLVIDRRELDRPGPSFTCDTLVSLREDFPDWRFVFVLGGDAFASLPKWEGIEDLIQVTHFWVFGRGDGHLNVPDLPLTECESLAELATMEAGGWLRGAASHSHLASSQLRNEQADWQHSLPPIIHDYIRQHGLYRSPGRT